MAYNVSQTFKELMKEGAVAKSCILLFDDCFFATSDITQDGVTFNQYFNTSDDLTFGDCPSDTLSFSVISNGYLSGYGFGKCKAYLGVQTASETYEFGDINAHIEVGGYTWTASPTGLYCNGTREDTGEYVSLVSDGTYVYAVGLTSSYRANINGSSGSTYVPTKFMAQKLRTGLSAVFNGSKAYVWDGENVLTYEYVPMGVYNVAKPRSTVGDIITIQDAYDNMSLFDVDASEFLASLSYPKTLAEIYYALCDYIGVEHAPASFEYNTTSYSSSPFGDQACSCRDILSWIGERGRCVMHFNRYGQLSPAWLGSVTEAISATDIAQSGYSMAEYKTQEVTGVLLKSTQGASLSFGAMINPYSVYANPFVATITDSDLQAYRNIMTYVPLEVNIIEADPSIDMGDLIDVHPMVEEIVALTNVYNQIYAIPVAIQDEASGEQAADPEGVALAEITALAVRTPAYSIPLMNREITFNGGISAKYVATGNEKREVGDDISYNASVAVSPDKAEKIADNAVSSYDTYLDQEKVFNRLTNNGQMQGIYMADGDIYVNASYIKAGTLSANYIQGGTISGSSIDLGNGNFTVDGDSGAVVIKNGSIALGGSFSVDEFGKLTASSGTIGGFNITSDKLYSFGEYYADAQHRGYGFYGVIRKNAGPPTSPFIQTFYGEPYNPTTSSPIFEVLYNGIVNATVLNVSDARITGGSISIDTSDSAYDVISLSYTVAGTAYKLTISPSSGISVSSTYNNVRSGVTITNTGVVVSSGSYSLTLSPTGLSVYIPSETAIVDIKPVIVSTW